MTKVAMERAHAFIACVCKRPCDWQHLIPMPMVVSVCGLSHRETISEQVALNVVGGAWIAYLREGECNQ